MENKNIPLVAGIVGLVALGMGFLVGNPSITVTPPEVNVVQNPQSQAVGAISGPDVMSPYFGWGGVNNWSFKKDLGGDAASTTICVIQAPQVASSSLQFFGYRANTGTGTAMELKVYKSASKWLATTQLGGDSALAANQAVVVVATSSAFDSVNSLFSANDWLVVRATVAAGGAGTSSPTGVCQAQFVQI
jgi:hypothetical protein